MFWQSIVRNWIAKTAKERLYEEMSRAAREQAGGEAGPDFAAREASDAASEQSPRQRPCDVGIVFGLPLARGAMEDRLDGVLRIDSHALVARQGGIRGRHVVLVDSAADPVQVAETTKLLIAGCKPAWVIAAGLASGLQPELRRGDIVMADCVLDESGRSLAIDLHLDPAEAAKHPGLHVGRIVTLERPVTTPTKKREFGSLYAALAADRETFAVADVCRAEGTRFLAIRAILDPVDVAQPAELGRISRPQSGARRVGGMLGAVWNRPAAAKDMLDWQERALTVSDRLAKFLEGIVTQLVRV